MELIHVEFQRESGGRILRLYIDKPGGGITDRVQGVALLWTPDSITWYVDGAERWSIRNEFHKNPLHMMFDSEIMEAWGGLPDPNDTDLFPVFEADHEIIGISDEPIACLVELPVKIVQDDVGQQR